MPENIAVGEPYGEENLVNQTYSPAPLPPLEIGPHSASISVTSITRSSNVATVTATGHGAVVGDRIRILGAVQPSYNREFTVASAADANTLTFTVYGAPTSPATGTITMRVIRESYSGEALN